MDYVSAILGQQAQGSQSLSSYPYGRSPAKRARRSEPESSALQNVEHATKRVRVDIGVDANPLAITEINLDQPCLLRRRFWPNAAALLPSLSDARRLDMARRIGLEPNPEPQVRQAPSLSPRAARQRSDLERSRACVRHQTPLRQPQTSPQRSSSCRPETNGAFASRSPKPQPASTR